MIIIGQGALSRTDGAGVLAIAAKLAGSVGAVAEGWNGFAVLHTAASRFGGLDLGEGVGAVDQILQHVGTAAEVIIAV
ncbi:molybdopterin-dependent oxidoreductase, partial [Rhizobium ruizarguesonis]